MSELEEQTENSLNRKRNKNQPLVLLQISSIETFTKLIKLPTQITESNTANKVSNNYNKSDNIDMNNNINNHKDNHNNENNCTTHNKSISIFLEINDITIKHDPRSSFLKNIAQLLTPTSPKGIIQKRKKWDEKNLKNENRERDGYQFYGNKKMREDENCVDNNKRSCSDDQDSIGNIRNKSYNSDNCDDNNNYNNNNDNRNNHNNTNINNVISIPYTVSKINVKINKCYLDYICPGINSRTFLTFGYITLSSTIVSNSQAFSFKFSTKDFSLYLSNQIFQFPLLEQNPLNVFGNRLQLTNSNINLMKRTREPLFESHRNNNNNENIDHNNYKIAPQSGKTKTNKITFDLDRFLDAHSFIQIITIDECTSLIVINPVKDKGSNIDLNKNKNKNKNANAIIKSEVVTENETETENENEKKKQEREMEEGIVPVPDINNPIDLTLSPFPPPSVPLIFPPFSNSIRPIVAPISCSTPTNTPTPCPGSPSLPVLVPISVPVPIPVPIPIPFPSTAFSVDACLGLFCLYVCMDSVDVLTVRKDFIYSIFLLHFFSAFIL